MKRIFLLVICLHNILFASDGLFRDPIKAVVVDTRTGLMWQDDDQVVANSYTWLNALQQCSIVLSGQNFAGRNDWRLPNINELKSIIDYSKSNFALFATFQQRVNYFWSSSTYASDTDYAWGVQFDYGAVSWYSKESPRYVRCVRGN